ncbi:MAG: type II toxin-antitoxin system VapC family toxin [Betaproteobacteria bacterium]|nr:type II toxin-antitoxin system VapC family toxin [Betaproteobacteria bacterium]
MMIAVADASVAVKWFLPSSDAEQDGDQAIALLQAVRDKRVVLREPAHWLAEVAAVLSRLTPATARGDIELLHAMRIPVVDAAEVYTTASKLAIALNQHVFDTLYHALALLLPDCMLVTADERYYRKARSVGTIILLAELALP